MSSRTVIGIRLLLIFVLAGGSLAIWLRIASYLWR
jgi:hypothetical protein